MRYLRYITALLVLVLTSFVCAVCAAQPSQAERDERLAQALNDPSWHVDDEGRIFRTAFPPHDRVFFGYGIRAGNGVRAGKGIRAGKVGQQVRVGVKTTAGIDFAEENIWWRLRHTFAEVEFGWGSGARRLEPTVVRGDYLRHDMSSFVVIPTETDIKLPAPFDIGVDYELGTFELHERDGAFVAERVDVAEVAIPLDFIRDPNYRHRLAIGPAGAYRLFPQQEPWRHELAPLTGAKVVYAWESADGLYQLDLRASCMSAVTIGGSAQQAAGADAGAETSWQTGCEGRGRVEIIAFSINDQPVSIPAEFDIADRFGDDDGLEWSATIGLRLSFVKTL